MADWSGVLDELAGDDAAVVTALRFVLAPSRVLADDDYEMEDALESGGDAVAVTAMVLGTERTQTLVDAVGLEEPLDVAEMLRIHVRVLDAQRVVASGDKSIADCVAAVRELPPTHWARRDLLHSLAVHRPITEVLAFDSFDSFERSVLGPALQRRVSGHEAVRAMLAAGHGLESIARAVTEHWPETPLPSAPRDAVETIARLLVACGRPVSELFDFVPSDAVDARLLGRLRPSGLRASVGDRRLQGFQPRGRRVGSLTLLHWPAVATPPASDTTPGDGRTLAG